MKPLSTDRLAGRFLIVFSFLLTGVALPEHSGATEKPIEIELINPGPPSSYRLADVVISLERTRCYGTCAAYTVQIFGDGKVRYEGYWGVDQKGPCHTIIAQNEVLDLLKHLYAIRFFKSQSRYAQKEVPRVTDGLVEMSLWMVTDQPTKTITVRLGDYKKRVELYAFVPSDLAQLPSKIDAVAGTKRWVQMDANHPYSLEPCY